MWDRMPSSHVAMEMRRVLGKKWFCSVIDADLYLMTTHTTGRSPKWNRRTGALWFPDVC